MNSSERPPDDGIRRRLEALKAAESRIGSPPQLEHAVLAAWDAAHRPAAAARHPARRWRYAGAIAATTLLAAGMTLLGNRLKTATATPDEPGHVTLLLIGEPILHGESARVVRVRMPASALPSLGIRSAAGELTETVDVDVLVGEDGVARAIKVGM